MNESQKIAVVTGSSYGLGLSITKELLVNGFKVYGISRTSSKITNDNFVWLEADLLDEFGLKDISEKISEKEISLLINNAGTAILEGSLDYSSKTFNETFGLNFIAPIKLTGYLNHKLSNGIVMNISSNSDRFAQKKYGMYSASKAALNIYFDTIATENKNMKIFNLLPSYIDTPLQHSLNKDGSDPDFKWEMAMDSDRVAECVSSLFKNNEIYPSFSRIMIVSNTLIEDTQDPEKLWYYNVDTKEFKKLK